MKKRIVSILILALLIAVIGCSKDPNPQIRVRNERLDNVNMKIQTSGNNEVIVNNVGTGQTSDYQTASEGNVTATIVSQNESISFIASKNTSYTIIVQNNIIPSMRVEQE